MANDAARAAGYLQAWHDRHPGATSAVLGPLVDRAGRSSYEVLAEASRYGDEPALDLACGDGQLLDLLRVDRSCLGADRNAAELNAARLRLGKVVPLVRADAARLPIATASLGSVTCHFALMLLQPLEEVLAELARVLGPNGLLAMVLPASPPGDVPNPWSALRAAWRNVTTTYPVDTRHLQDERALHPERLAIVLTETGFTSVSMQSFSVSKPMTVDEAERSFLLTYLPELLQPAGLSELKRELAYGLAELAAENGTITFVQHAELVTARNR